MSKSRILLSVLAPVFLLLVAAVGLSYAQGLEPPSPRVPQDALGTAFTYQGQLEMDGEPVDASCDLAFRLYDNGGLEVGDALTHTVAISDGLFTQALDFGAGVFDGDARWLGIQVMCPGDNTFADLGRQALTAAPYAQYASSTGALHGYPLTITIPAAGQVLEWDGATWGPALDDDTAYTAGTGLALSGTEFSITSTFRLPQTCTNGQAVVWDGMAWGCTTDAGGDVTGVYAGEGLTGGGAGGEITLTVAFSGTGSADTAARSDHDHDTAYVNEGQVDSVTSAMIVSGTVASTDLADGATLAEILDDDGSGSTLDADLLDGQHASAFTLAGTTWNLTGNASTTPGTNYLGTTDNQALEIRVNNARALRLEPGTSPNLIGGYSGNWVAPGVFGAVIGGGGQSGNLNRVVDHVGVIGGGQNNQAGSDNGSVGDNTLATVAGGANNTASGTVSAIGGGSTNTASGGYSGVGGGRNNTASGGYAFVGGGRGNQASGPSYGAGTVVGGQYNIAAGDLSFIGGGGYNQVHGGIYNAITAGVSNLITTTNWANVIGGGYGNVISGTMGYATIGGGRQNNAGNSYVTIAGGRGNSASGGYATVAGGHGNTASGGYATVPGGVSASATHFGEQAYASGGFAVAGDAQASTYVLRRQFAMAAGTWHDLFLDGNSTSQRLTIAVGRTVTFDILISGRTEAGESAGYRIEGVIENVGGTTTLVGTPTVTVLGEDDPAWNVQVLASDELDALLPQVQGNGETIRWVATVETAEVAW